MIQNILEVRMEIMDEEGPVDCKWHSKSNLNERKLI